MQETNYDLVKCESKSLYDSISLDEANDCIGLDGFIISHPYTNSGIVYINNKFINLYDSNDNQIEFRNHIFHLIDKSDSLWQLFLLVNKPYRLVWFKMISEFLSDKDFGELFSEIWVTSENPNDDVNVDLEECIDFFTQANKKYLMNEDEYKYYKSLPEKITVYRGVSKGRNPKGLSYTLDKDKAIWFQNRFADENNKGFLIEKMINKSNVLAYYDRRGESEIVLNTMAL